MPTLDPATLAAADQYWAAQFGCTAESLNGDRPLLVPHAGLGDYHGIFLFRRARALIVSTPPALLRNLQPDLAWLHRADLHDPASIARRIPASVERAVGPAWLGYADRTTLRSDSGVARLLTDRDADAYAAFQRACDPIAWEHGGSAWGNEPLAGVFDGDRLMALAGYEIHGDRIAQIAIVTDVAARGNGYGCSAVSLIADVALQRGLIAQYRTLHSNTAAITIARRLGFVHYADTLAFRLA